MFSVDTQTILSDMPRAEDMMSLHNLFLSTSFGIWVWEPQSNAFYFNAHYMNMLGYAPTAFPFCMTTWEQLVHPDDREQIVAALAKFMICSAQGDAFENRFRMRMASGEYLWILSKGFVLGRNAEGHAIRVSGMHIDLETLTRSIEKVAISHDRMSFALEAARDGLWDWNVATNEVYYSPRYLSMLGYTAKEFLPTLEAWCERVHPDDLDSTLNKQLAHINNPELGDVFDCVYRFMAASGSYMWILGRGKVTRRDATGKATRLVGLHTDITELRTAQDTLSQLLNLDALTRLHSRFFFDAELARLEKEDLPISIIFGDVDGLKLLNDHLGHAAGDWLLSKAASLLRLGVGRNTVVARIGGDEFAILLRGCPEATAKELIERIQEQLALHNATPGALPIYMSLGSVSTEVPVDSHKLLALADRDMLTNKQAFRSARLHSMKTWLERETGTSISVSDVRLA